MLYVARDVQLIEQALRPALQKSDIMCWPIGFSIPPRSSLAQGGICPKKRRPRCSKRPRTASSPMIIQVDVDPTLARARRNRRSSRPATSARPLERGSRGWGYNIDFAGDTSTAPRNRPIGGSSSTTARCSSDLVARLVDLIDEAQGGSTPKPSRVFVSRRHA